MTPFLSSCLPVLAALVVVLTPVTKPDGPHDLGPVSGGGGQTVVTASGEPSSEPMLALAAASLADVLPEIAAAWEVRGGQPVRFSFAATSQLAQQALRGNAADLFISADREWLTWLEERGRLGGPSRILFGNTLVVVVPAASELESGRAWASRGGSVAIAGENVPAGRYAQRALETVGVWSALAPRVVRGGSVRTALEWVARGEAEAGVVYATDASSEPRVRVVEVFDGLGAPAVHYPGAVLHGSPNAIAAAAFLDFVASDPEAASIAAAAGFEAASGLGGPEPFLAQGRGSLPDPVSAVRLSLLVGLLAAVLGLAPAVLVGWLLARRDFRGKAVVSTVVLAPLVMPPVVTGFLLLWLMGSGGILSGPLTAMGVSVPFTFIAPVLAAVVVGFPLYVVAVRGAFEAVDPRYEELSWTLGAPPSRTFLRVSVPMALPGIAAGAVLAFARALGEFGATIVLAGNIEGRTRTIALAVYTLLEAPSGQTRTWVLVGASVALSLAALLGYEALSRRQRRRLEDHRGR